MFVYLFRLFRILRVTLHYGLDEILLSSFCSCWVIRVVSKIFFWRNLTMPRGARLRRALEDLGPIFIKFGQLLSTRRDLIPEDIVTELVKLQDQVTPFDSQLAVAQIEAVFGTHPNVLFSSFEYIPFAAASVAQVHFAVLKDGTQVAVKILRPGIHKIINCDIGLMHISASFVEKIWVDGRRLKIKQVVIEFDKYLHDELDLMREAANASQLRRNFFKSNLLVIPEIYWDYCSSSVIVMERMYGIPISQTEKLLIAGFDLKKISRDGVEIFFTQVFRDGFFHADMHPGNILISTSLASFGRYIAFDFGIVGTLTNFDKDYLSQNFLAFFKRDYKRVAEAHIESGWAPQNTRVDELEAAVRACCEPIFDRPLKRIAFSQILFRLFQISRRFNVEVQPQLVLLQKTLLNIEGLGLQLDPNLDLWKTAKPYLERWMNEQIGWQGFIQQFKTEIPHYGRLLTQLPRLTNQALNIIINHYSQKTHLKTINQLSSKRYSIGFLLGIIIYLGGIVSGIIVMYFFK